MATKREGWWWNPKLLRPRLAAAGSWSALAEQTGVPRTTLASAGRETGVTLEKVLATAPPPKPADPVELVRASRDIDRLTRENASLRSQLKVSHKTVGVLDVLRREVVPSITRLALPNVGSAEPEQLKGRDPVTLVGHWNDWHWGEIVDPDTVSDQNAYDPDIAASRIRRLVDVTATWIENYSNLQGVDRLVIALNGDQFSGQHVIHPDSADEYARIAKQGVDCAMVTAQAVAMLAPLVPKISIEMPAGDNHTRSTRRPPTGKAALETSWSAFYAELMAALLINQPSVDVRIHRSYKAHVRIHDTTWAFAHGHGMKGGGGSLGIPVYALKRMHDGTVTRSVTRAKASQIEASLVKDALAGIVRHTRIGHFHQFGCWQIGEGTAGIAPSLKGVDSFVVDQLERYSPAGALLEAVHPRYDIIGQHVIGVQDVMEESDHGLVWGALEGRGTAASLMYA